jgi:hypothetical protein
MIAPAECILDFIPTGDEVKAHIVSLSLHQIREGLGNWWNDPAIEAIMGEPPIDRYWDWTEVEIEQDGRVLESELVGAVTDDGYIQGVMLISREPVPSMLEVGEQTLFVELLFTSPHNRTHLRKDRRKYFGGVGLELLRWGSGFSRDMGFGGLLRLDGSPDYLGWYERVGFRKLSIEPIEYEGVEYKPMELAINEVESLIGGKR